jgi:hypothetical protein
MKSILFATAMLVFGCSTLPRAEVATVSSPVVVGDRPGALVSGPAILHLNTGGRGQVTVYLVDDSGVAGDSCPSAAADAATTIEVLTDVRHVSDVPIPGGKRACALFTPSSEMSLSWLAEVYPRAKAPASEEPAERTTSRGSRGGVMLARR